MTLELTSLVYGVVGAVIGGGLTHFFKRKTEQLDEQAVSLPTIAQSIHMIKDATESIKKNIEELYESRNAHNVQLAEITTLHRVLNCIDKAPQRGNGL